jgi:cytochrome c553
VSTYVKLAHIHAIGLLATLTVQTLASEPISYSQDVQPILAQHCYTCHGPDASSREADLRLDQRPLAIAELPSGNTAIVPGHVDLSELIIRIQATDDSRMPPEDHRPLSASEIDTLEKWITQGAAWDKHWAFQPLQDLPLDRSQPQMENFIDAFLLQEGYEIRERASAETLLRRVYLGVIGIPPSLEEMSQFLTDEQPDALARLVDQLLASPHYGERWGRHWLDVARYADSNGGDENHSYPHAHRYRDYVINAFNRDTPYDVFVQEQLAGDLLSSKEEDAELVSARIAATGYLAIGMKILAEPDSVKKQADIIDEQIDTFGRTFLGLSLGCARCHDHKFDPITSEDYYALAGIFHSSKILDQEIPDTEFHRLSQEHDTKLKSLRLELQTLEPLLEKIVVTQREAEQFDRGNVVVDRENYGKGIGIIGDQGGQPNFVEYDIEISEPGNYSLELRYAAAESRPGRILVDGKVAVEKAITKTTGSWFPESQSWHAEEVLNLTQGRHVLRIESEPLMSHIDRWRLLTVNSDQELLGKLRDQRKQLQQLVAKKPVVPIAMTVQDAEVQDVALHRRGSHLDLGDTISRGVINSLGAKDVSIGDKESGRLHLAQWLTSPNSPASALTARVIVNRVWHWHFGKGLVESTDDFGLRGTVPQHGKLLDSLASYLIRNDWSLKALHRQILSSDTYQQPRRQGLADAESEIFASKRLEPEVVRDSMLAAAGELDRRMFDSPMEVTSQNPSPEDAEANQEFYVNSRRRSVYLPVVRTNVYDYFTLFDFPNVATPLGRRDETTVPTQALWMLNSRFIDEISRVLANRVMEEDFSSDNEAFEYVIGRVFTRSSTTSELAVLSEAIQQFRESSKETDDLERQRDAWSMLVQTLFMSSEAIDTP